MIDVPCCFVPPGLIDNHTHLSMPFMGMMSSDDYDTGTRAAAAGGVTCLVDFAVQRPPDNLTSVLQQWSARSEGAAHAPRPYGRATPLMNVDYALHEDETASASVRHTFCRGTMVYDRGEILASRHGRFVRWSLTGTA